MFKLKRLSACGQKTANLCLYRHLSKDTTKKLNVVMDIDECMIHSIFDDENTEYRQDDDRKLQNLGNDRVSVIPLKCEDEAGFRMHVRPLLFDFLKEISANCNVYAFTAALPIYARPVLKHLDPTGEVFQNAWFRHDCTMVKVNGHSLYTKDVLKTGGLPPDRTVLVDNNVFSFIPIPQNGIHVKNFTDDPNDRELEDVLSLLNDLNNEDDVRPALTEMFQLERKMAPIYDVLRKT
jgi:Dullard-like phosphatase family protein